MSKKSVFQQIQERVQKATAKENIKLQKEKDPVKQVKIGIKIQRILEKIVLDEIQTCSNKEFEQWLEEITTPFGKQIESITDQFDDLAFKTSKNLKDFENYKKIQKLKRKYVEDLLADFGDSALSKKILERYLTFMILGSAQIEYQGMTNNIEYNELTRAINLVNRRLKFDHNWFTCMGLIQLHENLIKKKIKDLEGKISGDEPITVLISKLSQLIKNKENRDITLDLQMSEGLKKIRDLMTHEGYRHKVTKDILKKITKEVEDLELTLYDEKFSISNS